MESKKTLGVVIDKYGEGKNSVTMIGETQELIIEFTDAMHEAEEFRKIILSATLSYFANNPADRDKFIAIMEEAVKISNQIKQAHGN